MSQSAAPNVYKQGHSASTISTHLLRTAENDAAFLLPHLTPTSHILDVGCGPGTITTGFLKHAPQAHITGIDIAPSVLEKARSLASEASIPSSGPGSVLFEEGNVLGTLKYPDASFDVVYASQVLGHFTTPGHPEAAIAEIRRVLKPNGILATRDGSASFFFPRSSGLDRLWTLNLQRVLNKGQPNPDPVGGRLPAIYRSAGFDVEGGKVIVGFSTGVAYGKEGAGFLAKRAKGQLVKGDPFYQSWLDAGISEEEIGELLEAVGKWAENEDAYHVSLQCEMLAWN